MKKTRTILFAVLALIAAFFLSFAETKAASPNELTVPVSIRLDGTVPETAESYVIEMRGENADTPMPEGTVDSVYTMTITGEGTAALPINTINYTKVGVYNYTVTQIPGNNPNCTYDTSVYNLKVTITNAEAGDGFESTVALRKEGSEEKYDGLIFNNIYTGSVDVEIDGLKLFNGIPALPGTFSFILTDDHGKIVDVTANGLLGRICFDKLTFDSPGVYHYQVREIIGVNPTVVYDDTVYDIYITVTNGEDGLETHICIKRNGVPYCGIPTFCNKTRKPVDVNLDVDKLLDGHFPEEGQFEFAIIDEAGNIVQTVRNGKHAQVKFDELTFYLPGVYKYKVVEIAGDDENIIYDDTVYEITITVTPKLPTIDGYNVHVEITVDGEIHTGKILFNNTTVPDNPDNPDDPIDPDNPVDPDDPDHPDAPVTPDEPVTPDDSTEPDAVKTGDAANIGMYLVIMLLALLTITFVIIRRIHRN